MHTYNYIHFNRAFSDIKTIYYLINALISKFYNNKNFAVIAELHLFRHK